MRLHGTRRIQDRRRSLPPGQRTDLDILVTKGKQYGNIENVYWGSGGERMKWVALIFVLAMLAMHFFMHRGQRHDHGKDTVDQENKG